VQNRTKNCTPPEPLAAFCLRYGCKQFWRDVNRPFPPYSSGKPVQNISDIPQPFQLWPTNIVRADAVSIRNITHLSCGAYLTLKPNAENYSFRVENLNLGGGM
jgi:hypothetical protein